jgi:putative DNA-invertase from lambdoid prophage Rac
LESVKAGDVLIVPEISRLARSVKEVHEICSELLRKKVQAHFVKQALQLKADLPSKIIVNAFGLAAEIEADLISQRTKAGLAAAKARGVKLGNPKLKRDNKIRSQNALRFARSVKGIIQPMVESGKSVQSIVDALNESKVPARRGGNWHRTGLIRTLKTLGL